MKPFSQDELDAMPELRHLTIQPGFFGSYRGTMFDYRRKVELGETSITGLTRDESIAVIDQVTNDRIFAMKVWTAEMRRKKERAGLKIAAAMILVVALLMMVSFLLASIPRKLHESQLPPLPEMPLALTQGGIWGVMIFVMGIGMIYAIRKWFF